MTVTSALKSWKSAVKTWLPILKTLRVEPAAFFLMTSALTSYLVQQDLILERVCTVNLNLGEDICNDIVKSKGEHPNEEIQVQKIAAGIRTQTSIIIHTLPLFFILFLGPWSDIYGRKIPMVIGTLSYVISHIGLILCSYFKSIDGIVVSIIINILRSALGANVAFSMAAHSYVADTTDKSIRTIRTGILSACSTLGVPVGFALGGSLRKADIGYMTSFAISGGFSLLACLIVIFNVENSKAPKSSVDVPELECEGHTKTPQPATSTDSEIKSKDTKWWRALDPRDTFVDVIAIPFKRREGSDRLYICLLFIAWMCVAAPIHGEFGVMYLFLRNRLHWDAGNYGYFSMYNFLIGVTGTIVSMGLFKHLMKLSDPLVGFIAGISQFSGCIIYAFATSATMMYLAPTVDMMNGTMIVIARSMMSKIVLPDEMGKTFTLVAILETLVPLVMDPVYSMLYGLTVDIFSGYFFILSAALTVPPQFIYAWFIWHYRCKQDSFVVAQQEVGKVGLEVVNGKGNQGVLNPAFSSISINGD